METQTLVLIGIIAILLVGVIAFLTLGSKKKEADDGIFGVEGSASIPDTGKATTIEIAEPENPVNDTYEHILPTSEEVAAALDNAKTKIKEKTKRVAKKVAADAEKKATKAVKKTVRKVVKKAPAVKKVVKSTVKKAETAVKKTTRTRKSK